MSDTTVVSLNLGERFTLLFLLNSFQEPERTSSVMRKTKRVKHAIKFKEFSARKFDEMLTALIENSGEALECPLDKDSLDFLLSLFEKFKHWPTALDEWIDTAEEKVKVARLKASEENGGAEK
jgi:hypothetical protein